MTERLAGSVAPWLEKVSSSELNRLLRDSAASMDGRLMVLDADGKVQYDTFGQLCGRRLALEEVRQVLTGGEAGAYGIYTPGRAEVERMSGEAGADYVGYSAHAVRNAQGTLLGVVLFVSRVQRMMDSLFSVRRQLLLTFALIALGALILALILSQVLTRPITDLSRTMRKMGMGDLSVRTPVRGSGELRELAENYNAMAAQLENMDETRSQFVSNASHELKTPLATMKIMLETLMYQPEMPEELRQEFMSDMNHEIDRLTGIITDLLTLTSSDAAAGVLRKEPVNLSDLTVDTVRLLTPAAKKRHQRLTSEVQPGLELLGDRGKLNQILYNLMDNAIKYTPDGGEIHVSLTQEQGDLVWRVRDNGVGIPEEDLDHVFERFYRVDKARSRETGGSGLGLSIVRQMAVMHGGTVSVRSQHGQGSEFEVVLPKGGVQA